MPIPLDSLVLTTLTLAIETNLRTAAPVEVTKGRAVPEAMPSPQRLQAGRDDGRRGGAPAPVRLRQRCRPRGVAKDAAVADAA